MIFSGVERIPRKHGRARVQRAAEGNGQEGKGTCARKRGLLIRDATDQSQAQNKQEESSLSSLAAINLSTVATSSLKEGEEGRQGR